MAIPHVNFTEVDDSFDPVPAGRYRVEVTGGKEGKAGENAKNPGSALINWEMTIQELLERADGEEVETEYEGRKLWMNSSFVEKALPMLKRFLKSIGLTEEMEDPEYDMEIEDVVGRQCDVVVTIEPYQGVDRNRIVRTLPIDEDELESALP